MRYRVEIGSQADAQLAELDSAIGASIERKVLWLAENAAGMVHRRLVGMPDDLAGLCKLRVGDYRILYWIYPAKKLVRIYRVQHRSEVYRQL
jgi:mRNA interferase RelE/StbE